MPMSSLIHYVPVINVMRKQTKHPHHQVCSPIRHGLSNLHVAAERRPEKRRGPLRVPDHRWDQQQGKRCHFKMFLFYSYCCSSSSSLPPEVVWTQLSERLGRVELSCLGAIKFMKLFLSSTGRTLHDHLWS